MSLLWGGGRLEAAGQHWIEYPSRSDEIDLWSLGDFHWDEKACARELLSETLAEVAANDHAFAIGMGDYASYLHWTDNRFDPRAVAMDLVVSDMGELGRVVTSKVARLFAPIKHRLVGLLSGNHEVRYNRERSVWDLHAWLCTELGVPNMGYSCIFDLIFRRNPKLKAPRLVRQPPAGTASSWQVRVFAHHGAGAAATKSGKILRLEKFVKDNPFADLYLMAHVHDQNIVPFDFLGGDNKCQKIVAFPRLATITGGFRRAYAEGTTDYAEMRGYPPTVLGATRVVFVPDKREIRGEIRVRPRPIGVRA